MCLRRFVPLASVRAAAKEPFLFDHLVGGDEQLVWHSEPEHPGGLVVDDELELARLRDRQIRRLRPLENAIWHQSHMRWPSRRDPAGRFLLTALETQFTIALSSLVYLPGGSR